MPTIASEVDVSRFSAAMRSLADLAAAGTDDGNLRAGMTKEAEVYMDFVRLRFESASNHDGTWPDLSPLTKYERARKAAGGFKRTKGISFSERMRQAAGASFPILNITGKAFGSLTPGGPGSFLAFQRDRLQVGSAIPHLRYHQKGGSRLPQRPIMIPPDGQTLDSMTHQVGVGWAAAVYAKLATV